MTGLCECGCGGATLPAPRTRAAREWIKGQPMRFLSGHRRKLSLEPYRVDSASGCWVWLRGRDLNGYGYLWDKERKRNVRAHVAYYEEAHGAVPNGLELDHLCFNTSCCNPAHLEPVTHLENCRRRANTKLTPELAEEIRQSAERAVDVARRCGISPQLVTNVRAGRRWAA